MYARFTYWVTPKSVVNSRQVDAQQAQRYSEQVERQKTVKMFLGFARERVVHGRRRHTDLKKKIKKKKEQSKYNS